MTSRNLAMIFTPCLFPSDVSKLSVQQIELCIDVLQTFIDNPRIFGTRIPFVSKKKIGLVFMDSKVTLMWSRAENYGRIIIVSVLSPRCDSKSGYGQHGVPVWLLSCTRCPLQEERQKKIKFPRSAMNASLWSCLKSMKSSPKMTGPMAIHLLGLDA